MSVIKRVLLESVCVVIFLMFVFLRFYKEVVDVKEDEESYEWINMLDVVFFVMFLLIVIFSLLIDGSLLFNIRLVLRVFVDVLVYIFLMVFGMVVVRIVRKWF